MKEENEPYLETRSTKSDTEEDGIDDEMERDGYIIQSLLGPIQVTTDPNLADTDEDGLTDCMEYYEYCTNPMLSDTDNDQIGDADDYFPLHGEKQIGLMVHIFGVEAYSNDFEHTRMSYPDFEVKVTKYENTDPINNPNDFTNAEYKSAQAWDDDEIMNYENKAFYFDEFNQNSRYQRFDIQVYDDDQHNSDDTADIFGRDGRTLTIYYDLATGLWSDRSISDQKSHLAPTEGAYIDPTVDIKTIHDSTTKIYMENDNKLGNGIGFSTGMGDSSSEKDAGIYFEIYPYNPDYWIEDRDDIGEIWVEAYKDGPYRYGDADADGLSAYAEYYLWQTDTNIHTNSATCDDTDQDKLPDWYDTVHGLFSMRHSTHAPDQNTMIYRYVNTDWVFPETGSRADLISIINEYEYKDHDDPYITGAYNLNTNTKSYVIDDPDRDGIPNYEEFKNRYGGANPNRQDLFVEMDRMGGQKITDYVKYLVGHECAEVGVGFHLDDGNMKMYKSETKTGGEVIPREKTLDRASEILDIMYGEGYIKKGPKGRYEYEPSTSTSNPKFNEHRRGIFRYCIIAEQHGINYYLDAEGAKKGDTIYGHCNQPGFVLFTNKIDNDFVMDEWKYESRAFMHEMGHYFELYHTDATNPSPPYPVKSNDKSCMRGEMKRWPNPLYVRYVDTEWDYIINYGMYTIRYDGNDDNP